MYFSTTVLYVFRSCVVCSRAPAGCVQYFTGLTGTVSSYNFQGMLLLQAQNYQNCIRQEEGYCSFTVTETPGIAIAFSLDATITAKVS